LLDKGLTVVKCHDLLSRQGVVVPERALHRYALEVCGHRRGRGPTARIADGRPGDACKIDFGRTGSLYDPVADRNPHCPLADLHRLPQPALLRVNQLHPDHRGGDRRL